MAMLEVKNLEVCYGVIRALHGISFEVQQGQIVSLIGANGAGKTTLLRMLAGVETPTSGRINKMGDITIGYLPQVMMHVDGKTLREDVLSVIGNRVTDIGDEAKGERSNGSECAV